MQLQPGSSTNSAPAPAHHRLTSVPVIVLMVHSRCNCRCVMCDIWKIEESRGLQADDLLPHLADFRALGVEWVVFSGGEPLMNSGLFPLARLLKREGIRLTLLTTGILLERYASLVSELIDEVIVSLDGPREIHNAIRRVPRAFDLLTAGVAAMKRRSRALPIRARTTIQHANHARLCDTVKACKDLTLDSVSFLPVDVSSTAFNRDLLWPIERQDSVSLSLRELPTLESEIDSLIGQHSADIASGFIAESPQKLRRIARHFRARLGLEAPQSPVCNAPWTSAVIDSDGTLRPCFFHQPIGTILSGSFSTAINGDAAVEFRSALDIESNPVCQRCVCSLNYSRSSVGGIL